MTPWTVERGQEACLEALLATDLLWPDTRVIERPGWYQLVTPSSPGTSRNEVVISQLRPEEADRVIDETLALYRAIPHGARWWVGPWSKPEDLGERLARKGLRCTPGRGMGRLTAPPYLASDVAVTEVTSAELEEFLQVDQRGWGTPPSFYEQQLLFMRKVMTAQPRNVFWFAARIDGRMVGTAALLLREDFGYLIGGQVLESGRGHGAYRALVNARLAFLDSRELGFAVSHAREETSAPILERMGFETLVRSNCYELIIPRIET